MTTLDLKRLREDWTNHWERCRFTQSECLQLLDAIEQRDRMLDEARAALEKCHEELVGHLFHEGGDLVEAVKRADAALTKLEEMKR